MAVMVSSVVSRAGQRRTTFYDGHQNRLLTRPELIAGERLGLLHLCQWWTCRGQALRKEVTPIDTEAQFTNVYRAHYEDALRFVRRRAHPMNVDDIVGETFLAAWRRRRELPGNPRPWLFGAARNVMALPALAWVGPRY
jgi:hypothetical protein